MSKKSKLFSLIATLFTVFALAFVLISCSGDSEDISSSNGGTTGGENPPATTTELSNVDTPKNVKVDGVGKVTWGRVTGASEYRVDVNGNVKTVRFTNFDLLTLDTLPTDGKFSIKVQAANAEYESGWSDTLTYNYEGSPILTPTVSGIDGTVISWTKANITDFEGISKPYPVVIVGNKENKLASDATSFDLASVNTVSDISINYVGDGIYYKDSAKIKLIYNPTSKSLSLAAPTNVHMEGDILTFDKVEGANIYYFKDVYNTVTSSTSDEINALASDREGHFLIQSMWAGNTDLNINDSLATDVTYFKEEEGSGTEDDPFLISTTAHLRYIEYYEAMGQAKYYKLTNDIAFKEYTPENDEDYSNFYNLGSLSGVIDGDNHSLKNIVVYYKDGYSSIFDSITKTGKIKNLKIENTAWRTWTNRTNDGIMHEKGGECSILAYTNSGTIENITLVSGNVTAVKDGASGLVSINRGTIKDCTLERGFTVYGNNEAGGFAIYNAGTIEHCINNGIVSGASTIGGIVGRNAGLVTKCGNNGDIKGDIYAGGIVGYNYNIYTNEGMQYDTMVSYCYNKGTVTCTAYAGGIVGRNGSDGINELGKEHFANAGIYGCYNRGSVSGIISIGGIAGYNYAWYEGSNDAGFGLRACYSTGDINYNVSGFEPNRLYLSVSGCSWAEVDSPDIRIHMWVGEGGSQYQTPWPGLSMNKTTIGSTSFYYVDMPSGISTNNLTGVIFNRVNANDPSEVFNQTDDILKSSTSTTAIYYIDSNWKTASLVEPCAGAIAGYNNMLNDCYYALGAKIGGTNISLTPAKSGSFATVYAKSTQELRQIAATLNEVLGVEAFVSVENRYPALAWEE